MWGVGREFGKAEVKRQKRPRAGKLPKVITRNEDAFQLEEPVQKFWKIPLPVLALCAGREASWGHV